MRYCGSIMGKLLILLFHFAAAIAIIDLAEEIVLVLVLRCRERELKGLYRILKKRKEKYAIFSFVEYSLQRFSK